MFFFAISDLLGVFGGFVKGTGGIHLFLVDLAADFLVEIYLC